MWSPFKKHEGPRKGGAPVDRVMTLSAQGMSEPEIIRSLRDEGYSPADVDTAMKGAVKTSVSSPEAPRPSRLSSEPRSIPRDVMEDEMSLREPPRREPLAEPELSGDEFMDEPPRDFDYEKSVPESLSLPPLPEKGDLDEDLGLPPPRREASREEEIGMRRGLPFQDLEEEPLPIPRLEHRKSRREAATESRRNLEELTESVVEEKWTDFKAEINDIRKEFRQISTRVGVMEKMLNQMNTEKKTDIEEIQDSIDGYKQSITEIGDRMESMERALKDSLTPMMESLRSLSDTIKAMKSGKE